MAILSERQRVTRANPHLRWCVELSGTGGAWSCPGRERRWSAPPAMERSTQLCVWFLRRRPVPTASAASSSQLCAPQVTTGRLCACSPRASPRALNASFRCHPPFPSLLASLVRPPLLPSSPAPVLPRSLFISPHLIPSLPYFPMLTYSLPQASSAPTRRSLPRSASPGLRSLRNWWGDNTERQRDAISFPTRFPHHFGNPR